VIHEQQSMFLILFCKRHIALSGMFPCNDLPTHNAKSDDWVVSPSIEGSPQGCQAGDNARFELPMAEAKTRFSNPGFFTVHAD